MDITYSLLCICPHFMKFFEFCIVKMPIPYLYLYYDCTLTSPWWLRILFIYDVGWSRWHKLTIFWSMTSFKNKMFSKNQMTQRMRYLNWIMTILPGSEFLLYLNDTKIMFDNWLTQINFWSEAFVWSLSRKIISFSGGNRKVFILEI